MNRVREIRTEKGISQLELENKTGIDRGYISRIENGKANPSIALLEKIANALEVSLQEIVSNR